MLGCSYSKCALDEKAKPIAVARAALETGRHLLGLRDSKRTRSWEHAISVRKEGPGPRIRGQNQTVFLDPWGPLEHLGVLGKIIFPE